MSEKLMILPGSDFKEIRLVSIPEDYQAQEAYRKVTGLIARVEEDNADYTWEDVAAVLEESGFFPVEFILGPAID